MSAAGDSTSDDRKLIVAYLPRGEAHGIAQALHQALGIDTFHYGHGRGAGMLHTVSARDMVEVDTLSVVVPAVDADATFAFIFETAGLDLPGRGLMFQAPLSRAAALGLPLPEPAAGDGVSG